MTLLLLQLMFVTMLPQARVPGPPLSATCGQRLPDEPLARGKGLRLLRGKFIKRHIQFELKGGDHRQGTPTGAIRADMWPALSGLRQFFIVGSST
jgi:hypothetical protein